MSKHTAGPWNVTEHFNGHKGDDKYRSVQSSSQGFYIAEILGDVPDHVANAHLIASAPDLLAACKNLRAIIHDYLTHAQQRDCAIDLEAADKTISRAEGAQS